MCRDFIVSSKKKMFWFVDIELRTDIKNMMQAIPLLPYWLKPEDLFAPDQQSPKSLSSFLEQFLIKHTSYNWRNGEATYLVLLIRHCSFNIQRNLFHCKTLFAWYKISVCYSFFVICTIADSLERVLGQFPWENCPPGQLPSRIIAPEENCPLDKRPRGKLPLDYSSQKITPR